MVRLHRRALCGRAPAEDDGIPFETRMADFVGKLYRQMEEANRLDDVIRRNLQGLGFGDGRS